MGYALETVRNRLPGRAAEAAKEPSSLRNAPRVGTPDVSHKVLDTLLTAVPDPFSPGPYPSGPAAEGPGFSASSGREPPVPPRPSWRSWSDRSSPERRPIQPWKRNSPTFSSPEQAGAFSMPPWWNLGSPGPPSSREPCTAAWNMP